MPSSIGWMEVLPTGTIQDTLLASVEAPYYSPSTPAVTRILKPNLLHYCCQGAVPQLSPTSDLTNGNASLFLVHIASFCAEDRLLRTAQTEMSEPDQKTPLNQKCALREKWVSAESYWFLVCRRLSCWCFYASSHISTQTVEISHFHVWEFYRF